MAGNRNSGRPMVPTRLKELAGNPGKRPLNPDEPQGSFDVFVEPMDISEDFYGHQAWEHVLRCLSILGIMDQVDQSRIEDYCVNYSLQRRARDIMDVEGIIVPSGKGTMMPHPASRIYFAAQDRCFKFAQECGFTPVSRARVHVTRGQSQDPFAALIGRKTG